MNNIYIKILDFIILAKKLEFAVRSKFNYKGESIFKGQNGGAIPCKGFVELDGIEYEFYFHGLGIDFKSKDKEIHYNNYGGKDGLGVYFTLQGIFGNYNYKPNKKDEREWEELKKLNLIKQWMPEIPLSQVYYLV